MDIPRTRLFVLSLLLVSCTAIAETQYRKEALDPASLLPGIDWVGPDGIVYPDWTKAGVFADPLTLERRGIPTDLPVRVTIDANLAGKENAEAFTTALADGLKQASAEGGGVVAIPAGEFYLSRPFVVRWPNVVIRGAGRGKAMRPEGRDDAELTTLAFDFDFQETDEHPVRIVVDTFDGRVIANSRVDIYFPPKHKPDQGKDATASKIVLTVTRDSDGKTGTYAWSRTVDDRKKYDGWKGLNHGGAGPVSFVGHTVSTLYSLFDGESFTLRAEVDYLDGTKLSSDTKQVTGVVRGSKLPSGETNVSFGPIDSVITFQGDTGMSNRGAKALFTKPAIRGDRTIRLNGALAGIEPPIAPGSVLQLTAMPTTEVADRVGRPEFGAPLLREWVMVRAVQRGDGEMTAELVQPIRHSYDIGKGSRQQPDHVTVTYPLMNCGLEDLEIRQDSNVWLNGVKKSDAAFSWMKNVRVLRAGRNPLFSGNFHNEVRDCEFIDPRWSNDTSGASAYVGFFGGNYCLMDNVFTRRCRHAPNFSGGVGSVIRDSRFDYSDAQWHAGYGMEHLLENVRVDGTKGTGSYGWGLFAMMFDDKTNGPGSGSRNVVYNNVLLAPEGGAYLGGGNENWMVLWNYFYAASGPSLAIRERTRAALVLGNVFVQQYRLLPNVLLGEGRKPKGQKVEGFADAFANTEILANRFYGGSGTLLAVAEPAVNPMPVGVVSKGNEVLAYQSEAPMPDPEMKSVYLAQLKTPGGYSDSVNADSLYLKARAHGEPDSVPPRGRAVALINFGPPVKPDSFNLDQIQTEGPQMWLNDSGEPFASRENPLGGEISYGWTQGKPATFKKAVWSDRDERYITGVEFREGGEWKIEMPPGNYRLFLALGDSRHPEGDPYAAPEYVPNNAILVNGSLNEPKAPLPHDTRRAAFDLEVTVGADRSLTLSPAATSDHLKINFLEIRKR